MKDKFLEIYRLNVSRPGADKLLAVLAHIADLQATYLDETEEEK